MTSCNGTSPQTQESIESVRWPSSVKMQFSATLCGLPSFGQFMAGGGSESLEIGSVILGGDSIPPMRNAFPVTGQPGAEHFGFYRCSDFTGEVPQNS